MKAFQVFRRKDAKLDFPENAATGSALDRSIDETFTPNMGGGLFRLNDISNQVVLPYDEIAICIEGKLLLTVDGVAHELAVGDFAWMPKGTDVTFSGENAVAFYAVYPADWRTRNADA